MDVNEIVIEKVDREINKVIIHCSDTPAHLHIGADVIREWHVDDNGWNDIGYHFVIRRDDERVEYGRPLCDIGSHCYGKNTGSIGICLIGGRGNNKQPVANFMDFQYDDLTVLLKKIIEVYPDVKIYGHRDFDDKKACPCFSVSKYLEAYNLKEYIG